MVRKMCEMSVSDQLSTSASLKSHFSLSDVEATREKKALKCWPNKTKTRSEKINKQNKKAILILQWLTECQEWIEEAFLFATFVAVFGEIFCFERKIWEKYVKKILGICD